MQHRTGRRHDAAWAGISRVTLSVIAVSLLASCGGPKRSLLWPVTDLETPNPPAVRPEDTAPPVPPGTGETQVGVASFYGERFAGRPTASGEAYDPSALSAAHRALPFGTRIRVTNLENGSAIDVVVNDRGPFIEGRILDLSRAAAERLGFVEAGLARVELRVLPAR